MKHKILLTLLAVMMIFGLFAAAIASTEPQSAPDAAYSDPEQTGKEDASMKQTMLKIEIGENVLLAELADTDAARTLAEKLAEGSVTIAVSNFGGWEKVGDLPWGLPANDQQLTAQPGDIMLYTGNCIVLFYGENRWAYTRLGRIISHDAEALRSVLSGGESELTLSLTAAE